MQTVMNNFKRTCLFEVHDGKIQERYEKMDFDGEFRRSKSMLGNEIDQLAKNFVELYLTKLSRGYEVELWPVCKD